MEETEKEITIGVRLPGRLKARMDDVLPGEYKNRSEYIRELIRRDLAKRDAVPVPVGAGAKGGAS